MSDEACSLCGEYFDEEDLTLGLCEDCLEAGECIRCDHVVSSDELNEEGVCKGCLDGDEDRRQLVSDHRHRSL